MNFLKAPSVAPIARRGCISLVLSGDAYSSPLINGGFSLRIQVRFPPQTYYRVVLNAKAFANAMILRNSVCLLQSLLWIKEERSPGDCASLDTFAKNSNTHHQETKSMSSEAFRGF